MSEKLLRVRNVALVAIVLPAALLVGCAQPAPPPPPPQPIVSPGPPPPAPPPMVRGVRG